jgi:hypothetical protein
VSCDFNGSLSVQLLRSGRGLLICSRSKLSKPRRIASLRRCGQTFYQPQLVKLMCGLAPDLGRSHTKTIRTILASCRFDRNGVADYLWPIGGCAGVNSCRIRKSFVSGIPSNMQYIGLGSYQWVLGSHSSASLPGCPTHRWLCDPAAFKHRLRLRHA